MADLGISKCIENSTEGRTYTGTQPYMSPEQSRGQKKDLHEEDGDFETHSYNTDVW